MKLLIINYEYPPIGGGAASASRELAHAISNLGHSVSVLTSKTPTRSGDERDGPVQIHRVRAIRRRPDRSSIFEMLTFLVGGLIKVNRLTPNNAFDGVICFFSLPSGLIGWFLSSRYRLPFVVSLRGGDVPGLVPELKNVHKVLKAVRRKVLSKSLAVVANSVDLRERSLFSDPFPVRVIPNGVDTKFFSPGTGNRDTSRNSKTLLFVGRLHRQKNLATLFKVLEIIERKGVFDFKLTIVGDGPERKRLETSLEGTKIYDKVEFAGWQRADAIRNRMRVAHCLINYSLYEGLPNTVLEAMACGLPTICSDIAPHRELIAHRVTGFLVGLDDIESAAKSIADVIVEEEVLNWVAREARKRVLEKHRWNAVASEYLQLFDSESIATSAD